MKKLLAVFVLLALSHQAQGATINVPSDQPTIQAGINAALEGDTVLVAPDTYTGEGNHEISTLGKSIVVKSSDGPEVTIIDCEGYNGIVNIDTWEDTTTVLEGFTITNGLNGILLSDARLMMVNLIIRDNSGNGIYYPFIDDKNNSFKGSSSVIYNCVMSNNGENGLITETGSAGTITLRNCSIDSNQIAGIAITNAGIDMKHCTMRSNSTGVKINYAGNIIDSCLFVDNRTALEAEHYNFFVYNSVFRGTGNGIIGGVYSANIVRNCTFDNLTGLAFGGGVEAKNCIIKNCGMIANAFGMSDDPEILIFDSCQIIDNYGGINGSSVELILKNSTIKGNTGDFTFDSPSSSTKIEYCLFADNSSTLTCSDYHLLSAYNSTFVGNNKHVFEVSAWEKKEIITLENCLVSDNYGPAIINTRIEPYFNIECCDFYNNAGGNFINLPDQIGINGNISLDPMFCDPINGDYTISWPSPCNAFNNSCDELIGLYGPACNKPDVWHVYADGSGDVPTIQAAINSSMDYDTVLIHPGIYSGVGNNDLHTYGKLIVVKGSGGADSTIIDCEGYRGFSMDYTLEDSNTIIDGICFTNALSGINLLLSTPRLKNLKFCHNIGGGITNYYNDKFEGNDQSYETTPLVITNCEFVGNDSGGVYFASWVIPEIIIEDCLFDSNTVVGLDCGGDIRRCIFTNNGTAINCMDYYHLSPDMTIVDSCYFEYNTIAVTGQVSMYNSIVRNCGVGITANSTVTPAEHYAHNCLFENIGSVVFINWYDCIISNCIVRNSKYIATCSGAEDIKPKSEFIDCQFINNSKGIHASNYCREFKMTNCIYSGNASSIACENRGVCTIVNSTLVGNDSTAVKIYGRATANIEKCIIANNAAYGIVANVANQTDILLQCSDVYNNLLGNYYIMPDQTGFNGNISADPKFCDIDTAYSISNSSPCAPTNNECQVLMGAGPVGCGVVCGDVNTDGVVNISDAVFLINYLFSYGIPPYSQDIADVNCDNKINLVDIIYLVNYVFRGGQPPCDCLSK